MATHTHISMTRPSSAFLDLGVIRPTWKRTYQVVLLISDAFMLLLAFTLAYFVRFYTDLPLFQEGVAAFDHYSRLVTILIPVWLVLFALLGLYDLSRLLGGTGEYVRALNGCTSGMMLVIIVSFLIPGMVIARGWLLLAWVFSTLLINVNRWVMRRGAQALRQKGLFTAPTLIIGTNSEALSLAMQLRESAYSGLRILGFVDVSGGGTGEAERDLLMGLPVFGGFDRLPEMVEQLGAEEIVVASTALTRTQLLETTLQLAAMPQVRMALSSGLYEIFTTNVQVSTHNAVPLLTLNRLRLDPIEMIIKSLLDYVVVLLGAILLLPLVGAIALLIRLDSPGPIFYRRRVLGIGGKEFDAFKFRTMVVDGDAVLKEHPELLAELQATHKLKVDPRVTRVGTWLRRLSLDELPQLFNVLLGQMSLVGPRMIAPAEAALYGPMKQNLLTVKPGLTGLWQVSGRSDLTYSERVRLDMHYIRNYSIWLDLQILFFQTLPAVFRGRGAY
ncbi:MAG: sugar transferase [Caldilineaceae bacterium]